MNQQFAPTDATIGGQGWESLGIYTATSGTLNVSLSDNADGTVVADAIMIVPVQPPTTAPSVVDNSDAAFSETGSGWQGYSDSTSVNGGFRYCPAGTGQNTATWIFADVKPTAQYQVYATWTAAGDRADNAPYRISDGTTPLATVDMNQQFAPTDATIDGRGWESLGVYTATSGTLNVSLSDNADGIVVADGIRIVPVQPVSTAPSIVDNSDAAFSETGSGWQGYSDSTSVNGGFRYCPAGTGQNTAQWSFADVNPTAQYQVYATWTAAGDRASNAPYTISEWRHDPGDRQHEPAVRTRRCPIDGQNWESLGVFSAASGTLNVGLSDNANGIVVADGICDRPGGDARPGPQRARYGRRRLFRDRQRLAGLQRSLVARGRLPLLRRGHRRQHRRNGPSSGSVRTAQYQVYATWSAAGDRASNAAYTVSDGGNLLATVNVNQQFAPVNAQIDGQNWESLGVYTAPTGTLTVGLSDNADGIVVADGIRIVQLQPCTAPPTLPGIVDNGDAAFAKTGSGWQGYSDPSAYEGDFRYCQPGTGANTAQWSFANLPAGEYQVFTTWTPASNRADDAAYTISDGGTALATVPVNQQLAPSDATADGQNWASLCTLTLPSPLAPLPEGEGNTLTVSLSDAADGIVVADAVRLVAIDYAPTVLSTAPVNMPQGTTDSSLNLAAVFNNPNGPLSQLTFTVVGNSNATLVPAAWIEDQTLEFAAAQGLSGTSNVTILATDPAGESVQATVPIVLNALPAAPSGLTATAASASEIDLAWTYVSGTVPVPSGNGTGAVPDTFQVQRATNSSFTQNLTTVMTTAANATSCGDTSLTAATTYYYRVLAVNAAGSSAASNTASAATLPASTLPAGWSDADVGGPAPAGSALCSGSIYTVTGGGADIWGTADQFNFASQNVIGDQTLIARVTSLGNTNGWAKAGMMVRDSSAAGAICVDLLVTPSNGVVLQWRSATGGASSNIQAAGVAAPTASHPVWLKLVKNGSNYAAYYSSNGTTWTEVGSTVVTLSNVQYLAGLAVDSHDNGTATTATFDNVSVAASLPAGWTDADIGGPSPAGAASCTSNVYTLTGGGTDIVGTSDQFNYASQTLPGNGTIIAQVTSQTNSNGWAKAAIMIRSSSAAGEQLRGRGTHPLQRHQPPVSQLKLSFRYQRLGGQRQHLVEAGPLRRDRDRLRLVQRHDLDADRPGRRAADRFGPDRPGRHEPQQRHAIDGHVRQRERDDFAARRLDRCRRRLALPGRFGIFCPLSLWGRGRGWGRLYRLRRRVRRMEHLRPVQLRLAERLGRRHAGGPRDLPDQHQQLGQGRRDVPRHGFRGRVGGGQHVRRPLRHAGQRRLAAMAQRHRRPVRLGPGQRRGRPHRIESRVGEARQERQHLHRLLFPERHDLGAGRIDERDLLQQHVSGRADGLQPQQRHAGHGDLRQREPHAGPARRLDGCGRRRTAPGRLGHLCIRHSPCAVCLHSHGRRAATSGTPPTSSISPPNPPAATRRSSPASLPRPMSTPGPRPESCTATRRRLTACSSTSWPRPATASRCSGGARPAGSVPWPR